MKNLYFLTIITVLLSCAVSASNASQTINPKYFPKEKELTKGEEIELAGYESGIHICYELKLKDKFLAWVIEYYYYGKGIIVQRCTVGKPTNEYGSLRMYRGSFNSFFEKMSFDTNKKPTFKKLEFKFYDYASGVDRKNNYLAYWGLIKPGKYYDSGHQAEYHAILFDYDTEKILIDKLLGKCKIIKKYEHGDSRPGLRAPIIDLKNSVVIFDPGNNKNTLDCNFSTTKLKY